MSSVGKLLGVGRQRGQIECALRNYTAIVMWYILEGRVQRFFRMYWWCFALAVHGLVKGQLLWIFSSATALWPVAELYILGW